MKQVNWARKLWIGLKKFPDEALDAIGDAHGVEAVANRPGRAPRQAENVGRQEQRHRAALVELHRVAADSVAQVDRPGQSRRRPVGAIGQAGEQAAQATDDHAGDEGADEDRPGGAFDAAEGFVDLDPGDGAGQGAGDAVGKGRGGALQGVGRTRRPGARHRAEREAEEVARPYLSGDPRRRLFQPPAVKSVASHGS